MPVNPTDKKVYLHVTSIEKKPTIVAKTQATVKKAGTKGRAFFSTFATKLRSTFSKKRQFSVVKAQGTVEKKTSGVFFVLKKSIRELRRNFLRSLATIFIMALVLTTIGTAVLVSFITEQAIQIVNAKLDISVEVQDAATLDQVQVLIKEMQILPAIRTVTYISKGEALENFKKDHPDLTDFLQTYNINNPLPATLRINVTDPKHYQEVINFLDHKENSTIINLAKARDNFTERDRIAQLVNITDTVKYFLYFFITLFVVIGVLIIVATVQLTLQQRKRELSIMQVVGASFRRILSPFIWESILLSILSTALALVVLAIISAKLTPLAIQYFGSANVNITKYLQLNILPFSSILLGSALGISLIVTLLTAWRYLRGQRLL